MNIVLNLMIRIVIFLIEMKFKITLAIGEILKTIL